MPATPQDRLRKLGIFAGGGVLPDRLVQACEQAGIEPFIVAFEGQTDLDLLSGRNHILTRLGAAGKIINALKSNGIHDLVMIGSIRRPSLRDLKPDLRAAAFFARLGLRALGDDSLLSALRKELEGEGFNLHGVHEFVTDLMTPEGNIGRLCPNDADRADIRHGLAVSQSLGRLDVGQSVVVQEGLVLGVEAVEGTAALIRRCGELKRQGRRPILIKTCKPQQDKDIDLPAIGPDTIRQCAEAGFGGIALHAGSSLLIDGDAVVRLADEHRLFVVGVQIDA